MIGVLGGGWHAWKDCTLRELVYAYDAHQLDRWDQTAMISCLISNLTTTLGNVARGFAGKSGNRKPASVVSFNPYRSAKSTAGRITKKTFQTLRMIGDALKQRE